MSCVPLLRIASFITSASETIIVLRAHSRPPLRSRHAGSKSAIEARAAAAEERLKASKPKPKMIDLCNSTDDEWDDKIEWEDDDPEWSKTDLASWQSEGIEVAKTKGGTFLS